MQALPMQLLPLLAYMAIIVIIKLGGRESTKDWFKKVASGEEEKGEKKGR